MPFRCGRRLTRTARDLRRRPPVGADDARWPTLDEAVFDLYGLHDAERIAVRDGRFRASWQWKDGRERSVEAAVPEPHLLDYARTFLAVMDAWLAAGKRRHMRAEVFDLPQHAPLRVVRFVLEEGIRRFDRRGRRAGRSVAGHSRWNRPPLEGPTRHGAVRPA